MSKSAAIKCLLAVHSVTVEDLEKIFKLMKDDALKALLIATRRGFAATSKGKALFNASLQSAGEGDGGE